MGSSILSVRGTTKGPMSPWKPSSHKGVIFKNDPWFWLPTFRSYQDVKETLLSAQKRVTKHLIAHFWKPWPAVPYWYLYQWWGMTGTAAVTHLIMPWSKRDCLKYWNRWACNYRCTLRRWSAEITYSPIPEFLTGTWPYGEQDLSIVCSAPSLLSIAFPCSDCFTSVYTSNKQS